MICNCVIEGKVTALSEGGIPKIVEASRLRNDGRWNSKPCSEQSG